jgi:uncharacterized protein
MTTAYDPAKERGMMKAARLLSLVVFCAVAINVSGQTTPAPPDTHAKARRLLELTGAGKLGMQMLDGLIATWKETLPGVPTEFWDAFRAKVKADDLVEMLIPVYEKHLTSDDLDALIQFFSSPAGRRYVEKQSPILADSMKIGQAWGARLADEVMDELKKEGYSPKQ